MEQVILTTHRDISDILEECLERIASGDSIESFAERYPDRRAELVPLLRTAAMTATAVEAVSYDPAAKRRGLQKLMEAAERKSTARSGAFSWLKWRPALVKSLAVGLSAAVLMTATAWGTTMASAESVPGEPLYWIKRTKESISLMIPQSEMARAEKHVSLAVERGEEMGKLVIRGRYSDAEQHVGQIEYHIDITARTVGISGSAKEMPVVIVDRRTVTHLHARINRDHQRLYVGLMEMREKLPPDARHQFDMLRLRSELRFRAMLAELNGQGSPIWGPIWVAEPVWVVEAAPRR